MLVYLVGAGPGDIELLTLKGKRALEEADVIVYDALAADTLLNFCRKDAEFIYVGKISGNHALPQDKINQLLIDKAKENGGQIVTRLKGGDPYIFGRGGEEGEALHNANVPFEEVPGISSTIAGPAYAGIPVTHRTCSSSLTIITGHEDPTKPDSVHNWDALAKSASTLVFVMGMANLPAISKNLIQAGMNDNTPAALVYRATTPYHRSITGTIKDLPSLAKEHNFTNPCLIVVGDVVNMREKLNWYEQKPLLGKNIVVTRAREQASSIANMLASLGANVVQFPTIEIKPIADFTEVDKEISNMSSYDWVIFTSINGVEHFYNRLNSIGKDSRIFANVRISAIGPATAKGLEDRGIKADFVPTAYMAEGIVEGLQKLGIEGKKVLIIRAKEARELLPTELEKAKASLKVLTIYETIATHNDKEEITKLIEEDKIDCVSFGSSSTVKNFFNQIPKDLVSKAKNLKFASIGDITSNTLSEFGFKADIQPKNFTIPELVDSIKDFYKCD